MSYTFKSRTHKQDPEQKTSNDPTPSTSALLDPAAAALETLKLDEALDDGFLFVEKRRVEVDFPDTITNDNESKTRLDTDAAASNTAGMYTLPILATDPLTPYISQCRESIVKLLDECGAKWTALEFWYRGHGRTRKECRATVLIGVPEPEHQVWCTESGVMGKIRESVPGRMKAEVGKRIEVAPDWKVQRG
jgi:hypothetical protein